MKKIYLFILLFIIFEHSFAQIYWNNSRADKFFTYGVRTGLNLSKGYLQGGSSSYDFKVGYQIGAQFDLNLCRSFSISTEIYYIEKGYKMSFNEDETELFSVKDNASYIETLLLASYRIPLSDNTEFQVNIGPYFAYGLNGKWIMKNDNFHEEMSSFNKDMGIKRIDFGLSYGCAVTFSDIYLGVSYERSFVNISQNKNANLKNGSIVFCLGYNFN